jgi:hypothetical protein
MQADRTTEPPPTLAAVREALGYIRRRPRVFSLVTVKSAVGLGNGALATFPLLAASFAAGPIGTGLLFAARGLGALIGPLLMRRVLLHRAWLLPGLALSMAGYGVAYLGVAISPWFVLTLVLVMVAHLAGGGNWTISNYALQLEVPDALRGRVFATDMMIATLAISMSLLVVGVLVDLLDLRVLIACCAAATLLYAIGWWLATRRYAMSGSPLPARAGDGRTPPDPAVVTHSTLTDHSTPHPNRRDNHDDHDGVGASAGERRQPGPGLRHPGARPGAVRRHRRGGRRR